jgi:hypothetical protein
MKRLFTGAVIAILLCCGAAAFADTSVLIDFAKLAADVTIGTGKVPNENKATIMDFSEVAGASFTDEERAAMKTSLALGNWEVLLASSARSVANQSLSMTREAAVKSTAKKIPGTDNEIAGKKVLGVRVHFPVESFNSWAIVKPPFEIPAYSDKRELQGTRLAEPTAEERGMGRMFDGYGIVKNVGVLKTLSLTVYGANFPNGIGVIVADQDGKEQTIFLDYLWFDGWRKLTWQNPNYIADVRNRELRKYPLYPRSTPHLRFVGLIVYRDAMQEGGDFITYVKDVEITYDKAILEADRDINDEALWNILQQRYEARRLAELKRLGTMQVLQYLERQKMHVDTPTK